MNLIKQCTKCKENLSPSSFNRDKSTRDGLACWCRNCRKEYSSTRYSKNKEEELQKKHRYYEQNKETILSSNKLKRQRETLDVKLKRREYSLKRYFGITLSQYDELKKRQNHKCPICLGELDKQNYSYPVDHAHKGPHQGKIRAILHDHCNRFVMWRHDNPEQLRRAADLMETPLTDWCVPEEFTKGRKKKRKKRKVAK